MKTLLRQLTLAFMLVATCIQLNAATVTWDGGAGTSNWTDAMNWDTDALPTSSDDVDLNGSTVVLSANATVQRVYAGGSSNLTINTGVTLTITGFTGNDDGLEVQTSATLTNNGTIAISNINTGSTDADGLYSKGMFTNNGTITVANVGQHGVYLQGGTFINGAAGTITITDYGQGDSGADGIYADDNGGVGSTLNNAGSITVTMTGADDGMYVNDGSVVNNTAMITLGGSSGDNGIRIDDAGIFNNNTGATFVINSTPDDQLFLDNTGAFNNNATVNLNNAADVGLYVTDDGVFTNNMGSAVNISASSNYAVQIDANNNTANIVNHGAINITGGSNDGVRMQEAGVFNNMTTGALNITNAGDEGIQIDDGATPVSTFNNSGMISIMTSTDHGMEVFGTFNNMTTGTYQAMNSTDDGIRMRNAGVFNNDGAIRINGSGSEDIETDGTTFSNTATATYFLGSSAGTGKMEIKDDFDMGGATITFAITDTTPVTEFDQIQNFSAGNTMTITNAKMHLDWGSYVPLVGDKFKVIDGSGGVTGTFSSVTSSNPNIQTTINYSTDEVEVEVTSNGTGGGVADTVNVTFSVDMSAYSSTFGTVYVSGGFNGWSPNANPLTDQGNGIWSTTFAVDTNLTDFWKFQVDGWSDQESFGPADACTGNNNGNYDRVLTTGTSDVTLPTYCWSTCNTGNCSAPTDSVNITFSVNTSWITVDSAGLFIAGGGNFGNPGDYPMTDPDNDGFYEITVRRPKGFNSFYTFTNGNCPSYSCKEDISGQSCANPNNFNDRYLPPVYSDTTLTTCFAWCSDDGTCPTPVDSFDITFRVDMQTQTIDPLGVFLAGNFEGWQKSIVMDDVDSDGVYEATISIPAGDYEYKFVNGDWPTAEEFDPATNDSLCTVTDPSGAFTNRAVTIAGDSTLHVYCYDSCFTCEGFNVYTEQVVIDNNLFSVRPNITRDYTNIVFADNAIMEQKTIRVFNAFGQLVMTEIVENTNIYRMDVNRFPAGMYFINVQSENRMATKRLVIQQ